MPEQVMSRVRAKSQQDSKDSFVECKEFRHKSFKERLSEYDGIISVADFDWRGTAEKGKNVFSN